MAQTSTQFAQLAPLAGVLMAGLYQQTEIGVDIRK
jgi:hypothetical protein